MPSTADQETLQGLREFKLPGPDTFILARREGRGICVHSHVALQPTRFEVAPGKLGAV
jgi:hypothetical protein